MTIVTVVETIAANANDVFKVLGDFGRIKVGGAITAFELEGEGVGAVRTITMGGGQVIETVFIPEEARGTLCVSSQVGCAMDCPFCATGRQGFNRNLTAAEIIGQVLIADSELGGVSPELCFWCAGL